jgi:hypothetical protein
MMNSSHEIGSIFPRFCRSAGRVLGVGGLAPRGASIISYTAFFFFFFAKNAKKMQKHGPGRNGTPPKTGKTGPKEGGFWSL